MNDDVLDETKEQPRYERRTLADVAKEASQGRSSQRLNALSIAINGVGGDDTIYQ